MYEPGTKTSDLSFPSSDKLRECFATQNQEGEWVATSMGENCEGKQIHHSLVWELKGRRIDINIVKERVFESSFTRADAFCARTLWKAD